MKPIRKCENCSKKFYSSTGKTKCSACNRLLGFVKPSNYEKIRLNKALKRNCGSVHDYSTEIKILATKVKWNLINHIDIFRIADLYLTITCNDLKYSTKEPEQQVELMIAELLVLLSHKPSTKVGRPSRYVVQLNEKGEVIKEFVSVRKCSKELNYSQVTIQKRCNGQKTRVREILKWKEDI